jgi:S-adenosylmethionine:tRNA ribosyltransferase-isomerase
MTVPAPAPPEPAEARRPPEARGLARDGVRLLACSPSGIWHRRFTDLPELLAPGDLLVINTSRTLPAALPARRAGGEELTLHLSTPVPFEDGGHWVVEPRQAGARFRSAIAGERLLLAGGASARLLAPYLGTRLWVAAFTLPGELYDYLERHGGPIRYRHVDGDWPLELHQNVYATEPGSAESASAGRPFTSELIAALVARGIDVAPIVLHSGVSSLEAGEAPYPERYRVPWWTADRVGVARRVIAVGTTVVRALESAADDEGIVRPAAGWTDLVIGPERGVRVVDGLLTGFHDRDSSHLRMLERMAGPALVERSYRAAAEAGYLRHEFGDVMLLESRAPGRPARTPWPHRR